MKCTQRSPMVSGAFCHNEAHPGSNLCSIHDWKQNMANDQMGRIGFAAGLLGFVTCGVLSPLGFILSLIAFRKDKNNVWASWGIILSAMPCIFWFFWCVFVLILRY